MKRFLRFASVGGLLLAVGGCLPNQYWSNLAGNSIAAILSAVLSEFFNRLFQQI